MDWANFTQLWGPAVPMFAVFVWYLHRLIFKTVPRGFRTLREALEAADGKAADRHKEAMAELRLMKVAMGRWAGSDRKNRRRQVAKKTKTPTGRG